MKELEQAIRAVRSYGRNSVLRPVVEKRMERARAALESCLAVQGKESVRLGGYQVTVKDGQLSVVKLPPEGWEQLAIEELQREIQTQARELPNRLD